MYIYIYICICMYWLIDSKIFISTSHIYICIYLYITIIRSHHNSVFVYGLLLPCLSHNLYGMTMPKCVTTAQVCHLTCILVGPRAGLPKWTAEGQYVQGLLFDDIVLCVVNRFLAVTRLCSTMSKYV